MNTVEECFICLTTRQTTDFTFLPCAHKLCNICLSQLENVTKSNLCPMCKVPFRTATGPQPKGGTMQVTQDCRSLPGHEDCGSIVIQYIIPNGVQTIGHPHPGQHHSGCTRFAYLPDNPHGRRVCRMLRKAFDAGLIFTVGRSLTTGMDNVTVWNDIHHKTERSGTYGYPDPTYLSRVEADLRAKGITDPCPDA